MEIKEDEVVVGEFETLEGLPKGRYTFRIRKNTLDEDQDVEISLEGKDLDVELGKYTEPEDFGGLGIGKTIKMKQSQGGEKNGK